MTGTPASRPHARARAQLLLGLVPVLVVGVVLLVVLAVRLPAVQAPLAAAGSTAQATVVQDGLDPAGRGVEVEFTDAQGTDRTGLLVLRSAQDVAADTPVTVQYDPADLGSGTNRVYTDGDAAHGAVGDVVFGLVLVVLVLLVVAVLTGWRLLTRARLARRPTTAVTATHLLVGRGLLVRSWLELVTPTGVRWLPVHWAPELDRLTPDSAALVHGDPSSSLVLPVVGGQQVWPSGKLRRSAPRGDTRQAPVDPDAGPLGMGRQVRGDVVVAVLAPVLGLLWAYVDGSGAAGFAVATALGAAVLFWLPQLLGSDPSATSR
ncbi:hypothetical protein ASG36_05055 [Geodermatophilus sp. Leaf369]|uniref:hypothetical protein n=1 Tax=Geodermatophilus sp. Leaf369 TaxID=1736354 RepID=UPI0006F8A04D|nr:hypothetical protein [Geodermatophilus sp. Leaf369]KQS60324.1 hypothetical protein ASG36_05055 [Geodermatophilus sp. Leaf369]